MSIASGMRGAWPRILGKLFVTWAVRRWGATLGGTAGQGSVWPGAGPMVSPFAGQSWTFGNYVVGYIALRIVAGLIGRTRGSGFAHQFFHGGFDALLTKLVWTEGFARSPWLQAQFGNTGHYAPLGQNYAPMGQTVGDTMRTPDGQTWMFRDGAWQAMQGYGALVSAGPLDGSDFGALVSAGPLDGFGHSLPASTAATENIRASYAQSGASDPYAATYM